MTSAKRKSKRRKQERVIPPVPFVMLLVLIAALSLGYLWLGGRCEVLCKEIKKQEYRQQRTSTRLAYEESRWFAMITPARLEEALMLHNLTMVWPGNSRIVEVSAEDVRHVLACGLADGPLEIRGERSSRYERARTVAMNE